MDKDTRWEWFKDQVAGGVIQVIVAGIVIAIALGGYRAWRAEEDVKHSAERAADAVKHSAEIFFVKMKYDIRQERRESVEREGKLVEDIAELRAAMLAQGEALALLHTDVLKKKDGLLMYKKLSPLSPPPPFIKHQMKSDTSPVQQRLDYEQKHKETKK